MGIFNFFKKNQRLSATEIDSDEENIKRNIDLIENITVEIATGITDLLKESIERFYKDSKIKIKKDKIKIIRYFSFFETIIFLTFEIAFSMRDFGQDEKVVNKILLPHLVKNIIKSSKYEASAGYITQVCNERFLEYDNIAKNPKSLKRIYKLFLFYINTAITNEKLIYYKKIAKPFTPPLNSIDNFVIESSFLELGYKRHLMLTIFLKHLCRENDNFLILNQNEINHRMKKAREEILLQLFPNN